MIINSESIEILLKIILHQYFASARCLIFVCDEFGNGINLPIGIPIVNNYVDSDTSTDVNNFFNNYGCQTFLIYVQNPATIFRKIEREMKVQNETFYERSYLIIDKQIPNATNYAFDVFLTQEIRFVSNLLLISIKSDVLEEPKNPSLNLQDYDNQVFCLWTHRYAGLSNNSDPYLVDKWYSKNKSFLYDANLFPDKLADQHGREFITGLFEYKPYIIFDQVFPNETVNVKGLEIKLLNIFFDRHNITMKPCFVKFDFWGDVFDNGTVYGLRGDLYNDKVDMAVAAFFSTDRMYRFYGISVPTIRIGITCLVPSPRLAAGWLTPMYVYSSTIWIAIFIGYFIVVNSVFLIEMLDRKKIQKISNITIVSKLNNFEKLLFSVGKTFVNQDLTQNEQPKGHLGKYFMVLILAVTFFLCKTYESGLATIMTIPRYEHSIETRKDFLENNIPWGGIQVADWINYWKTDKEEIYRKAHKRYLAAPSEERLKTVLSHGKFGLLIERLPEDNYNFPFTSLENTKHLRIMKEDLHWEYAVFMTRKNSILLPLLNDCIFKANEAGLTYYWLNEATRHVMNETTKKALTYSFRHYKSDQSTAITLQVTHVAGMFGILMAGNFVAILVFVMELFLRSRIK